MASPISMNVSDNTDSYTSSLNQNNNFSRKRFPSLMDASSASSVADRIRRYSMSSTVASEQSTESHRRYSSFGGRHSMGSSAPGLAKGTSLEETASSIAGSSDVVSSSRYVNQQPNWSEDCVAFEPESLDIGKQHENEEEALIHIPSKEQPGTPDERLFVQMCFYARLGFVQPPSCLHCTYQEAAVNENSKKNPACPEWTVWRRNANIALHPEKLTGNLALVQCRAAQKLVDGEPVQGYWWDAKAKRLNYLPSSTTSSSS